MYLIDSSSLIVASRTYYNTENFPGVWQFLANLNQAKKLFSIDKVRQEITVGDDAEHPADVKNWLATLNIQDFFLSSAEASALYADEIEQNITDRYEPEALDKFINTADFSLIALAMSAK